MLNKKGIRKIVMILLYNLIFISLSSIAFSQQYILTEFNDSFNNLNFDFSSSGERHTYFIRMPEGIVISAQMRIRGLDTQGEEIIPADVILVTDTSGSMDDNCPDSDGDGEGEADPGETPCKINDAKNAALSFLDNVDLEDIHVGLVHYSNWGNTDIDLHVIEPTGEECYYGNSQTQIGGSLDVDVTTGYGPEVYTLAAPTQGTYQIKVKYYSDNGYPQSQVIVYVVMYEGTPNEVIKRFETMLTQTDMMVEVDIVTMD